VRNLDVGTEDGRYGERWESWGGLTPCFFVSVLQVNGSKGLNGNGGRGERFLRMRDGQEKSKVKGPSRKNDVWVPNLVSGFFVRASRPS